MPDPAALFADAAATVADLLDRVAPDAWDGPGLGAWDLRALVGHTSRSLVTVITYLDGPAVEERVGSAAEYYALIKTGTIPGTADPEAIVERGRRAGAQLGDDPAAAFRALIGPATAKVAEVGPDTVVETIAGGMRVDRYLTTRTFELVVHGLDIAAATGGEVVFAPGVLSEALGMSAEVAVRLGEGEAVLLALTGRRPLPAGFCVV
ncbi:maleylpyruvate isomerase N-terminal domain-containing protein [Pseudonocardia humida]|uniref:Maleylpyruvate isomerase N-terminal domain-containing protein n=1 Tax=Pseudonocardia humida TaxID=2800819 RepID=A0ABT1A0J2_9PSEU|nr:maleylpyruvate isomerase N-terminal domain-containing protein [Pseudonocardia humida]MCO1656514.1 maleylpyruvate isomerase N-terminal domain-containing protein [Pseudonocardia humida]